MAVPANHELGGCVIQLRLYLIDMVQKNYRGGFRVIGPFKATRYNDVFWARKKLTQKPELNYFLYRKLMIYFFRILND